MTWGSGPGDHERAGLAPRSGDIRMTAFVHGDVQGVGFRWWTRSRALELGLVGVASNRSDGRVEIIVEGPRRTCEALLAQLRGAGTPGVVEHVVAQFADARGGFRGFTAR